METTKTKNTLLNEDIFGIQYKTITEIIDKYLKLNRNKEKLTMTITEKNLMYNEIYHFTNKVLLIHFETKNEYLVKFLSKKK